MKIVFVNRFFFPDHSATSQILTELAVGLAAAGREVHVITSRQRYDDPKAELPSFEIVRGVNVHRIVMTRFGRRNLLGRAIDYFSFYISAFAKLLRLLRAEDTVVAMTDPPLISVPASVAAQLRRAVLINWLQDVFPEVAERLGVRLAQGRPAAIVKSLRNYSLRRARANVVLGERMAQVISQHVPTPIVIHNWAVGNETRVLELEESVLRQEWGLSDQFVVGYSGNLGRAHEMQTVLGAIRRLKDEGVRFLFIGGGHRLAELQTYVAHEGLAQCVMFRPYQRIELLPHALAAANVHLVSLQPSLEGFVVPSKFYGIAAAARPVLFIGDPDGEIARLVTRSRCGYAIPAGDSEQLTAYIRRMRDDWQHCKDLGSNGRKAVVEQFDRAVALARWNTLLRSVE